jgi:hypothetical protein
MKFRAALGTVLGVTLTGTGALAASSAFSSLAAEHAAIGGPSDNHGATVSTVAQEHTVVGGKNHNHGGAVSTVARGTHGPGSPHGKSAGQSQGAAHRSTR